VEFSLGFPVGGGGLQEGLGLGGRAFLVPRLCLGHPAALRGGRASGNHSQALPGNEVEPPGAQAPPGSPRSRLRRLKRRQSLREAFPGRAWEREIPNRVDAVFSAKDREEFMAAAAVMREKLSFAVGLSAKEKGQLAKIGRKSQTFTGDSLGIAARHPELMPGYLKTEAAQRDLDLFIALAPVVQVLSELYTLAEDTQTIAGSEAYAAARVAYKSAKAHGQGLGLDDVIDDLSQRFQQKSPAPEQISE
jgi:hypothetical protein